MSLSVSIVISTYNGEKYILEQIKSIYLQKREPDEVLICDDCSTDSTYQIIKCFIEDNKLNKWKLRRNQVNKGWRRNFVELVSDASGDLIFTCDQDDFWFENKLEIMERIMDENSKINLLVSYLEEIYDSGECKEYPKRGNGKIKKIPITPNFMNVKFPGCVYCLRGEFAKKCNCYWKETMPHDGLYWRMSMFDNSLYVIQKTLIRQKKHNDSAFTKEANSSHTVDAKIKEIMYTRDMISGIKSMIRNTNQLDAQRKQVLDRAIIWNDTRYELLNTRSIKTAFNLLKYVRYYQTFKRYLLDLYIVFIVKEKI